MSDEVPRCAMLIGKPTKGYKSSTIVLVTRKHRSKWWDVVCFGPKGHYRKDGSCAHTDEVLENFNTELAPLERVKVRDGREERKPA